MDTIHIIVLACTAIVFILSVILVTMKSSESYKVQMSNENMVKVCKQQCQLISTNPIFGKKALDPRCMKNCINSAKTLNVLPSAWV